MSSCACWNTTAAHWRTCSRPRLIDAALGAIDRGRRPRWDHFLQQQFFRTGTICASTSDRDATYKQLSIGEKIKSLYDADLDDEASHDRSSGPRRLQAHWRVGEPDQSVRPAGNSRRLVAPMFEGRRTRPARPSLPRTDSTRRKSDGSSRSARCRQPTPSGCKRRGS